MTKFWMALVAVTMWAGVAAADPLVGTWKMRPKQGGKIFDETIVIDAQAPGYRWNYALTLANHTQLHFVLLVDTTAKTLKVVTPAGKTFDTGTYKVIGTNAWEVTAHTHKSTGSVAADGKTMTVHQTVPLEAAIVFDRQ